LWALFSELCQQKGIATRIEPWLPHPPAEQMALF